jgi:hypothetical protein
VCVYMCVYLHVYMYIYIYIYTYTHTHTHMHIYIYIYIYIFECPDTTITTIHRYDLSVVDPFSLSNAAEGDTMEEVYKYIHIYYYTHLYVYI